MDNAYIKPDQEIMVRSHQDITKSISNDKQEIAHFTRDEMRDKLSRLPPNEHGMVIQFLWRTGIRVSEALGVRQRDLDFHNQEITIRWLKNRKYDTRVIPMHTSLKMPMWTFCAKLKADQKVFPFSRQYVHYLCKKYGFDHPHKIRHSFAVNFLRQSDRPMALMELKELLGHSHINTTMVYLRVVPMNQKKAMESILFD